MIEESKTWNDTYELTKADKVAHREAKECRNCRKPFDKVTVIKTCHHSWDTKVEYGPNREVVKREYLTALCRGCNINISNKNVALPCFAHNATKYDNKFIIKGIKGDFESKTKSGYRIFC